MPETWTRPLAVVPACPRMSCVHAAPVVQARLIAKPGELMLVPCRRATAADQPRRFSTVELIGSSNLALRFALELGALAALGYSGFQTHKGAVLRIALGIGAPILAAVLWSVFVAPAAHTRLPDPWRLVPEFAVFGSAAAGLVLAGHRTIGGSFAAITILNSALDRVIGQ